MPVIPVTGTTWNGQDISAAGTPASAFSLAGGASATVVFDYSRSDAAQVTNSTLQVTYLGVALTTSRAAMHYVVLTGVASAQLNWSFGSLSEALEGVFQLTASMLYANGSVAWSSPFFVFIKAPDLVESGAVVGLLVLTIAELYWGLAAIRDARRARPPAAPASPPGPPPGTTTPTGGTGPGTDGGGGSSSPGTSSPPSAPGGTR